MTKDILQRVDKLEERAKEAAQYIEGEFTDTGEPTDVYIATKEKMVILIADQSKLIQELSTLVREQEEALQADAEDKAEDDGWIVWKKGMENQRNDGWFYEQLLAMKGE